MFKKKHIITSGVMISLILFNAKNIQAEEQSSLENQRNQLLETEVIEENLEEKQSKSPSLNPSLTTEDPNQENSNEIPTETLQQFDQIIEQLYSLLSEEQKNVLDTFISNEAPQFNLFVKAVILHENNSFKQANKIYEQILHNEELVSADVENFLESLAKAAKEEFTIFEVDYKKDDSSLKDSESDISGEDSSNPEISEGSNNGDNNGDNDEINDEETIEEKQTRMTSFSLHNSPQTKTADEYYIEYQDAYYVSDLWSISQEFKDSYPNDSRLDEVVNHAAEENLAEGQRVHNNGDYNRAITYYNRLLNEPIVNNTLQDEAQKYKNQAQGELTSEEADAHYEMYQEAYFVSDLWSISQDFKTLYPNDSRVNEVVNDAAEENLAEGQRAHNNGNYNRAITYYNRLLNEGLVNNTLQDEALKYKNQAQDHLVREEADALYESYQEAYYVSDLWSISQDFKELYPNDSRVNEIVNHAAGENLAEGQRAHRNGNFKRALTYYNRVLGEELLNDMLRSETSIYKKQAEDNKVLKTADDYYSDYQDAHYVSELWSISQEFKTVYPNDSRAIEVVNHAATENLKEGQHAHRNGEFNRALTYYNRVLGEELVNESLRLETTIYKNQAKDKQILKTADTYYSDYQDAHYVSELWSISQEFKTVYPNDSRVNEVVNDAARENLKEGRRLHNNGDFNRSIVYYNRVLNEELVNNSLQKEAAIYKEYANINTPVKSANQYYSEYNDAYFVSDLWSISQEFKTIHGNDSRVSEVVNDAAIENLKEGRRLHQNGSHNRASIYYDRVLNEPLVKKSTRHLAEIFNNQTEVTHKPIVYIDAGHGGSDPGPVYGGVSEKTLNLNVSKYLQSELESKGYNVILSRESDVFVGLTDRAVEANRLGADIFVSVHHNSMGGSGAARGIETFIHHTVASGFGQETNRDNFDDHPRIQESLNLADNIHSNLIRNTGFNNRKVKGNNYNVLRNTYIPAVLLELGFMDNSTELSIIRTQSYQRTAASAIAEGIDNYFKDYLN